MNLNNFPLQRRKEKKTKIEIPKEENQGDKEQRKKQTDESVRPLQA